MIPPPVKAVVSTCTVTNKTFFSLSSNQVDKKMHIVCSMSLIVTAINLNGE